MRQDNRIHPRLLVRLRSDYRVGGGAAWHHGTVLDLSAGGATLITVERIPPKATVRLRLELPGEDGSTLEVECLVLRCDPFPGSGGNMEYRQALHFLDLHGETFDRVRRYIFERQEGKTA
jgi:c-di-GMP-binding flagellar brake protein YcgR